MSRRSFALFIFAALALGVLALFALRDDASAVSYKLNYSSTMSCGGADNNEGTTVDNSCAAGTGNNVGVTSDATTIFDLPIGQSNFANVTTTESSPAFNIALDSSIPNGAATGVLITSATLSILNGPCSTQVPVSIPLFDANTDVTNTIAWAGNGANLTVDSDGNGLADAIDKYPSFLNNLFNTQRPSARYYGYTNATAGAAPTQLNFVLFAPGMLAGTTTAPGLPKPQQELNASVGYVNYVILDNTDPSNPASPNTITDICAPMNVTTHLWGKTQGEGRSVAANGNGELSAQCTGVKIGVDDDGDTVVDDGCIVVNDKCGDTIDGDGDTKIDEYCPNATGLYAARTRAVNPLTAISGIYGSGTHLVGVYSQGYRDADNDGISNNEDSCPTIADGRESGAQCANALDEDGDTLVNDGCPPVAAPEKFPTPNQCVDALDNDGDTLINDGCPPVEVDADGDGLGAACDPNDAVALADQDGDGFQNRQDNCPLVANVSQSDQDSNRCNDAVNSDGADESPARVNDGCPAVGAPETACTDSADSDADTVVNDGCPLRGGISEFCVVSVAGSGTNDFGPCSDGIGDTCDANPTSVDGDYDKVFPRSAECIGAADADLDGWCDATETLLGSLVSNAGNPGNQTIAQPENRSVGYTCVDGLDNDGDTFIDSADAGCSVPEYAGLDYPIDPAPQSCSNKLWYASGTDPIGDGAAIDDDGDTLANAADLLCQSPPVQCLNSVNDDAADDSKVNDGCPSVGSISEGANWCTGGADGLDQDADTVIDDGCSSGPPANGVSEAADHCSDTVSDDPGQDTIVNDGCPVVGSTSEGTDTDTDAVSDIVDDCPTVYNPDQTNSDTLAIGGGDSTGDACDANDDGDGLIDTAEWAKGSDAKNPFSPFNLDLDGNGSVTGADASALKAWIGTAVTVVPAPGQVCVQ